MNFSPVVFIEIFGLWCENDEENGILRTIMKD
jgi:hypothetical protein